MSSAMVGLGGTTVPTPAGWLPSPGRAIPVTWYTAYCTRLMQSYPLTPGPQPASTTPPLVGPWMPPPPSQ